MPATRAISFVLSWEEGGGAETAHALDRSRPEPRVRPGGRCSSRRRSWTRRSWRRTCFVKIPGTEPGIGAIEDSIAACRSISIMPLLSLSRHKEVIEADIHGIERLIEDGGDPSRVASVVKDFLSRLDREPAQAARGEDRDGRGTRPAREARHREREARRTRTTGRRSPA